MFGADSVIDEAFSFAPQDSVSVKQPGIHRVVAIDGPAASGKSTVAQSVAQQIGFDYLNSGAMYRAVTWQVLQNGIQPLDDGAVVRLVEATRIEWRPAKGGGQVLINGVDLSDHLRDDRVNENVSIVSRVPRVRDALVRVMRAYASDHDVVMEGRDIGSVVFPDTPYKFYIDASPEVRMRRRHAQGERDQIPARDLADSSRETAPLKVAADATTIDSSDLSIPEVVDRVVRRLKEQGMTFPAMNPTPVN